MTSKIVYKRIISGEGLTGDVVRATRDHYFIRIGGYVFQEATKERIAIAACDDLCNEYAAETSAENRNLSQEWSK